MAAACDGSDACWSASASSARVAASFDAMDSYFFASLWALMHPRRRHPDAAGQFAAMPAMISGARGAAARQSAFCHTEAGLERRVFFWQRCEKRHG